MITQEKKIAQILKELGVPMGSLGFVYLKLAIDLVLKNEKVLRKLNGSDGLYELISKNYKSTPCRVERAIRHGIEVAFLKSEHDISLKYLGQAEKKLTNKNFIATLVYEIKLT